MHVKRDEPFLVQIGPDGIMVPMDLVRQLLRKANGDDKAGLKEDLEDFGPGKFVYLECCGGDGGTEITLNRDRRTGQVVKLS